MKRNKLCRRCGEENYKEWTFYAYGCYMCEGCASNLSHDWRNDKAKVLKKRNNTP